MDSPPNDRVGLLIADRRPIAASGLAAVFEQGLGLVVQVRLVDPGAAVLPLTTRVDAQLLAGLAHERVSCVSAFVDAYTIVTALRMLLSGQTLLPPDIQRALAARLREAPASPQPPRTSRKEAVLELGATGLTLCQIAARLNVSRSTVKTHLIRVYKKLDAPNRSAAVATAIARRMLRVTAGACTLECYPRCRPIQEGALMSSP